MKEFFELFCHRHRLRSSFYHAIAIIFLIVAGLQVAGAIDPDTAFWWGLALFAIDYLAEMYDPHPENPGPWFKSHFHRFFDDDKDIDGDGSPDI